MGITLSPFLSINLLLSIAIIWPISPPKSSKPPCLKIINFCYCVKNLILKSRGTVKRQIKKWWAQNPQPSPHKYTISSSFKSSVGKPTLSYIYFSRYIKSLIYFLSFTLLAINDAIGIIITHQVKNIINMPMYIYISTFGSLLSKLLTMSERPFFFIIVLF